MIKFGTMMPTTVGPSITFSSPLLLPNGTAAAPAIGFASQVQMGMWRSSSNNLAFSADSATQPRFVVGAGEVRVGASDVIGFSSNNDPSAATADTKIARGAAADTIVFGAASTGYRTNQAFATEAHTLAAAATSDTAAIIPAFSLILGVSGRVTTTITGCTTFDCGVVGATTRYGTLIALAANTTFMSAGTTNPTVYAAATAIRFTAIGGGASFTAGVIRVVVHYISLTPPTS